MRPSENDENASGFTTRLLYGSVVGAILGMIIGSLPANDAAVALIGMGAGAVLIGGLCVFSNSFWESLRAAWELLRVAFWRW